MSSGGSSTWKSKPLSPTYRASSSSELDPVCRTQASGPAASSRPAAGEVAPRDLRQRRAEQDAGLVPVRGRGDGLRDVGRHVLGGQRPRGEAGSRRAQRALDAVDPEGPPVAAARSQATRYQRRGVCTSRCGSTSRVVTPSRPGYRRRSRRWSRQAAASAVSRSGSTRSGRGTRPGQRHRRGVEGADPVPEPGRQHLLQLGQRPQRGLLQPGHAPGRGGVQADRHRHRLLVVQQQRRQRGPDPEPVAARHARRGVHRVAQVAQPVDVAAQGPQADAEPAASSVPVQSRRDCSSDSRRRSRAEVSSMSSSLPLIGARS